MVDMKGSNQSSIDRIELKIQRNTITAAKLMVNNMIYNIEQNKHVDPYIVLLGLKNISKALSS